MRRTWPRLHCPLASEPNQGIVFERTFVGLAYFWVKFKKIAEMQPVYLINGFVALILAKMKSIGTNLLEGSLRG
jgi:hypothetical protein